MNGSMASSARTARAWTSSICREWWGSFTSEATAYVEHIDPKVVLIDGRRGAELMVDFEVGVTTIHTFHVKRVDSDYFEEA